MWLHINMQKTSYTFHLFILQIQSILQSHHQTSCTHFWPYQAQKVSIIFCEIVPACKKSVSSVSSFLRYSQFYSPETRLAILIFGHAPPKIFLSTFVNVYQHAKNEAVSIGSKMEGWTDHISRDHSGYC